MSGNGGSLFGKRDCNKFTVCFAFCLNVMTVLQATNYCLLPGREKKGWKFLNWCPSLLSASVELLSSVSRHSFFVSLYSCSRLWRICKKHQNLTKKRFFHWNAILVSNTVPYIGAPLRERAIHGLRMDKIFLKSCLFCLML